MPLFPDGLVKTGHLSYNTARATIRARAAREYIDLHSTRVECISSRSRAGKVDFLLFYRIGGSYKKEVD